MTCTEQAAFVRFEYLREARIFAARYRAARAQLRRRGWGTPYWKEALLTETAALADLMIAVRWEQKQREMLAWEQAQRVAREGVAA